MADPNPLDPRARVADALRRHRRPLGAGVGLCVAALVAALAIPVGIPDAAARDARGRLGGDRVSVAPKEDLSAFAGTERWGGLTFDELEARRRAAEGDATTDAARRDRMGFVGTTATRDDRVVLLTLPGGEVRRVPVGGALPDGRTVSDVTDTTATLSDAVRGGEELQLFPRPPAPPEDAVESTAPGEPRES